MTASEASGAEIESSPLTVPDPAATTPTTTPDEDTNSTANTASTDSTDSTELSLEGRGAETAASQAPATPTAASQAPAASTAQGVDSTFSPVPESTPQNALAASNPGRQPVLGTPTEPTESSTDIESVQPLIVYERAVVTENISWLGGRDILESLDVSLVEASPSGGRYPIQVKNVADHSLASGVSFELEIDDAANVRTDGNDQWDCTTENQVLYCVSVDDVAPTSVSALAVVVDTTATPTAKWIAGGGALVAVFAGVGTLLLRWRKTA